MDKLIIGCGYLGRRVAERWLAAGDRVWATTRSVERASDLKASGIEPVVCDVLDRASLSKLPLVEATLYCVGLDRSSGQSMREVYVQGLGNVLDHLARPKRFVHVSSTSVYGQKTGEYVDEESATEPEEDNGRIVLDAEKVLRQKVPDAIILRFAGIYGPGRLLRQRSIVAGEEIRGNADRWLNLIHVEDGVRAVLAAESAGKVGSVYNVADERPVPRREFYTALARLLEAPEPRFVAPEPNEPSPPHEKTNRRIDSRRLREELAFQLKYPTFEEGLRGSIQ